MNTGGIARFRSDAPAPCVRCRVDLGHEVSRVERRAARYGGNCGRRLFPQVSEGRSHCEDRGHYEVHIATVVHLS